MNPSQNAPKPLMAENQLDTGLEQLDLGEAGQQETIPSVEEELARHEKIVTANTDLVEKMLTAAQEKGIISEASMDVYRLPNRQTNLRDLRKHLEIVTGKIDAESFDENEENETLLREQRALLVTEILYTTTALLKTKLGEYASSINSLLASGRYEEAKPLMDNLRYFEPQWTALTANSELVLIHYRSEFPDVISNAQLGELNASLYLGINLSDDDLPAQEKIAKGGTLVEIMEQVEKWLKMMTQTEDDLDNPKPIADLNVEAAKQPETAPATKDPSTTPITVEAVNTPVAPQTETPSPAIVEDPNAPPKPPVLS